MGQPAHEKRLDAASKGLEGALYKLIELSWTTLRYAHDTVTGTVLRSAIDRLWRF